MPRIIKRYDNRKMYDTDASRYVSLDDVAELIRSGETVEIRDKTTGEDLTTSTLTQIILEKGKQGNSALPADLLHDLVRRGAEVIDHRIDQIRHSAGDLIKTSVNKIGAVLAGSGADDLAELRHQLERLESMVEAVVEERDAENSAKDT